MSTSKQYIQFVCDCLKNIDGVICRKMFGEYIVYIRERPILLVCDNCVMVKKVPELSELMRDAQEGFPYEGAKAHYVLDIEDPVLVSNTVRILLDVTPIPTRKKRTGKGCSA